MPTAVCAGWGLGEKEDSSLDNLQMFVFVGSSPVPKVYDVCVFIVFFCVCVFSRTLCSNEYFCVM